MPNTKPVIAIVVFIIAIAMIFLFLTNSQLSLFSRGFDSQLIVPEETTQPFNAEFIYYEIIFEGGSEFIRKAGLYIDGNLYREIYLGQCEVIETQLEYSGDQVRLTYSCKISIDNIAIGQHEIGVWTFIWREDDSYDVKKLCGGQFIIPPTWNSPVCSPKPEQERILKDVVVLVEVLPDEPDIPDTPGDSTPPGDDDQEPPEDEIRTSFFGRIWNYIQSISSWFINLFR